MMKGASPKGRRSVASLNPGRASATLDQNENSSLARTWQVAFLRKAEPRAARPGRQPDE